MAEPISDERVAELEQAFGNHSDVRELFARIRADAETIKELRGAMTPKETSFDSLDEVLEQEAKEDLQDLGLSEDEIAVSIEQMREAGAFDVTP